MASIPDVFVSPEEYLTQERAAQEKSEYVDGRIYAMSGASMHHNLISSNLLGTLWNQLRGRSCRVFGSDLRISVRGKRFFYPDISVVCGPAQFHDEQPKDTVTNPTLVIEILSESTAAYDKGAKFLSYQGIASLQEYLMVHQDQALVEHYTRRSDDSWIYHKVEGLEASVELPSIECSLKLEEVYLSVFQA